MSGYVNLLKWCLYQEEINQIEMSGYVMVLKWCLYQEEYNHVTPYTTVAFKAL